MGLGERMSNKLSFTVGILFFSAIAFYGIGSFFIEPILQANGFVSDDVHTRGKLITGAILMLLNSVVVVCIATLMYPEIEKYSKVIAVSYLASRLIESVLLSIGVIGILTIITLSYAISPAAIQQQEYIRIIGIFLVKINYFSYQVAMIFLGIGSMAFCFALFGLRLIPRILSAFGFLGYAALVVGASAEIYGYSIGLLLSIPGGIFELVFATWLIYKGFSFKNHDI